MVDERPTFDIAAPQIAAYIRPLEQGMLAPPFSIYDERGRSVALNDDFLSGTYLALLFLNDPDSDAAKRLLGAFAAADERLAIVAVSADSHAGRNRALAAATGFNWPIPGDPTGSIFASYGLMKQDGPAARAVLLTPYRQIRHWIDLPGSPDPLETFMSIITSEQTHTSAEWAAPHAPVLIIPGVLSREECGGLIKLFEEDVPFLVRKPGASEVAGNYIIPVYEHNRQDRVDMILRDTAALELLDQRIHERIAPMVKKAYAFDITRREDLHIARYLGERSGNHMGHRDNTSAATAYRRFALSMNLNDDYEGGTIAFQEFSPKGYRAAPGTALVFSSSLLHEVAETTSGTRYNLISHLFNEAALQGK